MKYIQSFKGWKIYKLENGTYSGNKGRKWITGAMSLGIIRQTITQDTLSKSKKRSK